MATRARYSSTRSMLPGLARSMTASRDAVLAVVACDLDEPCDLFRDVFLLLERELDGHAVVVEAGLGSLDAWGLDGHPRVEQILHDHHRVVSLFDGLAVEVGGQLRQRLRVVVDADRDVLLRGRELARDLFAQGLTEAGHVDVLPLV